MEESFLPRRVYQLFRCLTATFLLDHHPLSRQRLRLIVSRSFVVVSRSETRFYSCRSISSVFTPFVGAVFPYFPVFSVKAENGANLPFVVLLRRIHLVATYSSSGHFSESLFQLDRATDLDSWSDTRARSKTTLLWNATPCIFGRHELCGARYFSN